MDQETNDEEYPKAAFWLLLGVVIIVLIEITFIGWLFLEALS